jgi:hypothetical protein
MGSKRRPCRRVLEGYYCKIAFSVEFGAFHRIELCAELDFEQRQRPTESRRAHWPAMQIILPRLSNYTHNSRLTDKSRSSAI